MATAASRARTAGSWRLRPSAGPARARRSRRTRRSSGSRPARSSRCSTRSWPLGRRSSRRGRTPPGARIEPWDYRYVVGEAERRLRTAVPLERLRPINDAHLRSLGADPDDLAIGYDIVPRRGRPLIPVAFTTGWHEPGPWVFATYGEGGLGNLAELLHESGHAIHYAAIRTRPAFARIADRITRRSSRRSRNCSAGMRTNPRSRRATSASPWSHAGGARSLRRA